MNEKIKELARQAGGHMNIKRFRGHWMPPPHDYIDPATVDLQKFAELIVKECGQVLVDNTPVENLVEDWDKGYDRAMNDCIHHIYEHFGVEDE